MAFDPDLASAISSIPTQYGVDPDYVKRMAVAESGGNIGANAATSSAAGPYQIIGSTADTLGISRADRYDPNISTDAISRFTADNAAGLQKAGFDTSFGNLYLSHFAGLGGARSVLGADPSTPVSQILPSSSIAANPFLRGMTAGDLTDWAAKKMGGSSPAMTMPGTGAGTTPGADNPGMSTGSTAAAGGFGLAGIMARGGPVAGQAAPAGVASLSAQPMTAMAPTAQSMMPGQAAAPEQASPYGQIGDALKSIAGGGAKQQQKAGGGGMGAAPDVGGRPVSLLQARQMFDPGQFFQMLQAHGVGRK